MVGGYEIRRAGEVEEFAQLADVFGRVFRTSPQATPPAWLMDDASKAGGLTLGLWRGEEAVGVSFAFVGVKDGRPYLFSDGLGVLPEHRDQGQAHQLKLAQREHALDLGYERIHWTFSALRSVNAHLYLTRLGAVAIQYLPDKRGALASDWGTEGGVPFDEFLVEWSLGSARVSSRLDGAKPALDPSEAPVLLASVDGRPELRLDDGELPPGGRLAVEVTPEYQELVDERPALAHEWHEVTSPLFARLFDRGYRLTECVRQPLDGRVHYFFEQPAAN